MPEVVRWGVIGSGGIARRRTIPEGIAVAVNARLAAVFDVDARANAEVASQFSATAAGSLAELLEQDVDAVYIASPVHAHAGQALACAKAGKHTLCEKPLGLTVAEAEQMAAAAREAGVLLGTGLMMRFQAQHRAAREFIRSDHLGKPVYGRAQLSCWYPPIEGAWRQDPAMGGGGSLMDMGGHCIDLLEMFFGPASRVSCFARSTVHAYPSEDSAVALIEFACGALGTVDTFFCIADEGSRNALELHGSAGSILAEGTIGQGAAGRMQAILRGGAAEGGIEIRPAPVNMYQAEIESFSRSVLDGQPPEVDAEAGVRSQKVLQACYESARTGRAIEV